MKHSLLLLALALLCGKASSQTLIYEPFDYSDPNLFANAQAGVGLSGNWTGNGVAVESPGLSYGSLAALGSRVTLSDDTASASTGATLNGFLDDGDTLWFSVLVAPVVGTNPDFGFALGTHALQDRNNVPMGGSELGEGLGFRFKGGLRATGWDNDNTGSGRTNPTGSDPFGLSLSGPENGTTTYLVVGEMIFGAIDTVNIYLPATDLNLGPVVSTVEVSVDQTLFNLVTFTDKAASPRDDVDEIRFGPTYDDVIEFPDPLIVRVNTLTGATTLAGDDDLDISFNFFQLASEGGSLNAAGWHSLADQDFDGNGPPDDTGNGWEEGDNIGPNALVEGYLLGDSTLAAGEEIDLGRAYDRTVNAADLVFRYRNALGQTLDGVVEYFAELTGDFNGDGTIDAADYTVWQDSFGQTGAGLAADANSDGVVDAGDYAVWRSNFGLSLPSAAVASQNGVPEPSSLALAVLVLSVAVFAKQSRNRL